MQVAAHLPSTPRPALAAADRLPVPPAKSATERKEARPSAGLFLWTVASRRTPTEYEGWPRRENCMRADFETIVVSRHHDHILLVTLNRPEVSNALNTRMGLDLMELFESLALDLQGLRAVIITGSGAKAFCAGGDLKERNGMTDESWQSQHAIFERMIRAMMGC